MRRFITNVDVCAREAWSRNDQVHLFFVLVNAFLPSRPRRSPDTTAALVLYGAQASRCISLVQLCLVSTRKKNCAVGRERTFRRERNAGYRGAQTKIKKRERKKREELPRAAALFPSTGYRNVNEPRHLPPSAGPFTKSRDADRRVFMFAPRFLPRDVNGPTRKRTSDTATSCRIFMNLGHALLEWRENKT